MPVILDYLGQVSPPPRARASDIRLRPGDLIPTGTFRQRKAHRPEYVLGRDIVFEAFNPGSGVAVIVPAGYVTDGYSLPAVLQRWQPKNLAYWLPAVVHDWLYAVGRLRRGFADMTFLQAMAASDIDRRRRWLAFAGVAIGGVRGFGKCEPVNVGLVEDGRRQGVHDWGETRAAREAPEALLERLNVARWHYGLDPLEDLPEACLVTVAARTRAAGPAPAEPPVGLISGAAT